MGRVFSSASCWGGCFLGQCTAPPAGLGSEQPAAPVPTETLPRPCQSSGAPARRILPWWVGSCCRRRRSGWLRPLQTCCPAGVATSGRVPSALCVSVRGTGGAAGQGRGSRCTAPSPGESRSGPSALAAGSAAPQGQRGSWGASCPEGITGGAARTIPLLDTMG